MKKVFSLLLMSLIMVGCDFLPTPSSNSVSTSNSSINSSLTITSSESLSSSDIKKEELQLLSFKAIDDNNASIMKMQKDNEDVQEVVLDEGQNTIFVEAIVRNESRYSFVDMVIYLSFLDTYVVFNEGNGNYICSTTTILENDMWVTKINFEVNVDFSESYYGYVEVNEITFFDLNSLKVNTNLNKVKSKKINYHKHYGESFKTIEPTCSMQGYDEYTCEYCGDKYKNNYVEINENNHSFIDGVCEYCDYKDYSFYVPKAPEGYIGLDINYHYVGKEIDDSIVKKDTYNLSYSDNINTFDYLATKNIINHKYTTNFVDGLIEHTQ